MQLNSKNLSKLFKNKVKNYYIKKNNKPKD